MAVALGDAGSVGVDVGRLGQIDALMQGYVDRGVYAGIATVAARRGVVDHASTYGWSDRETGTPMAADTCPATFGTGLSRTFGDGDSVTRPSLGLGGDRDRLDHIPAA